MSIITDRGSSIAHVEIKESLLVLNGLQLGYNWQETLNPIEKYLDNPEKFKKWYNILNEERFNYLGVKILEKGVCTTLDCESFKNLLRNYFINMKIINEQKKLIL